MADTWFTGVVPPNTADEATPVSQLLLMEEMLAQETTGVADLSGGLGGGGGSSVTMVETLWTDDSLAFYVRVDNGTTITWKTPTGTTSAAPGTGIRPAGGASLILDTSRYQAIAAGTGFAIGDYLSHVVTADPATGVVIAFFWLNVTQNTKLAAAPSSASIAPITPLATGAATDSNLTTIAGTAGTSLSQPAGGAGLFGWLSGIYSKLSGTLAVSGTFWQATQPVSITSMPTTAVTGTFWQATQPVSAAALPLPTGAATAALQSSIVTALGSPLQAGGSVTEANSAAILAKLGGTLAVEIVPEATAGYSKYMYVGLAGTPQLVKASAGEIVLIEADNLSGSTAAYLQIYDTATLPTFGTGVVDFVPIPANGTGGFSLAGAGAQFANGVYVAAATTPGGAVAPATGINVKIYFK